MAKAKRSAASASASSTSAASTARGSSKGAAAFQTAKKAKASKTSKAAKTGTSAKRAARAVTDKSTIRTRNESAVRQQVVKPTVRPFRITEPRVRVERLDAAERAKLRELGALVAGRHDIEEVVVVGPGERRVSLTRTLLEGLVALGEVLEALDRSPSVTVVADDDQAELTSQEAADLLNVSRPYVVKLARDGVLAHHRVGNRHRFMLTDVLAYRDQMRTVREETLAELAPADGYTNADY